MREVAYVTSGWGIHDDRWIDALTATGVQPMPVSVHPELPDSSQVEEVVRANVPAGVTILAGPLNTITRHIVHLPNPVIGLSWGFDLVELDGNSDLAWLPILRHLIVDSPHTAAICRNAGVSESQVTLIPWGVDLAQFTPEGIGADLTALQIPHDAPVILTARRHEPIYRVGDVIAAIQKFPANQPQPHVIVANTGSLTSELHEQAIRLGVHDRVHFIGEISEDELAAYLRSADVYVSASEVDGSSVTLLQAMAVGTPVVVSDIPGNRAWLTYPAAGLLFACGEPDEITRQISRALQVENAARVSAARSVVHSNADWYKNLYKLCDLL